MSKIKLIVEIDEEYFHMIQKEGGKNYPECAILHGTPLDNLRAEISEYKDNKIIHLERNEMIDIVLRGYRPSHERSE